MQQLAPYHKLPGIAAIAQPLVQECQAITGLITIVDKRFAYLVGLKDFVSFVDILIVEAKDIQMVGIHLVD